MSWEYRIPDSCADWFAYSKSAMLSFLPIFPLAQAVPIPVPPPSPVPIEIPTPPPIVEPQIVVEPQEVRPLPGQLNQIPVFNSNSPEVVLSEGILLSTFPGTNKAFPAAHLNYTFSGMFEIFSHHIARTRTPGENRPMYKGILVSNPGRRVVTLDIMQAVSYINPDAPFIDLPPMVDNATGNYFSGPGSRVMTDILRGVHQAIFPQQIVLMPGDTKLLASIPIPLSNTRSSLMRVRSSGPVHLASLAMHARPEIVVEDDNPLLDPFLPLDKRKTAKTTLRPPSMAEWEQLLQSGNVVFPRDRVPTPPRQTDGNIIYGRVAGVAIGSKWSGEIVDRPGKNYLTIPQSGKAFSYALSTVPQNTLGTRQVQSAPLAVRYPDTAYQAHGNYGVHYNLTLPLYNPSSRERTVELMIQTPLKQENRSDQLAFYEPVAQQPVFFRGTVQISYRDDQALPRTRMVHLVQRRGQRGNPLVTLRLPPQQRRLVQVDFLYPPDATPPQVLTLRSW